MAGLQHSPYGGSGSGSNFPPSPVNPPQASAQSEQTRDSASHQRTYQACIPCRRRKVRCDLGSVDNPHDPPCLRCRREAKECFFSATRRKRKNADDDDEDALELQINSTPTQAAPQNSGRKKLRANPDDEGEEVVARPRTPGGSVGRNQPLRRPLASRSQQYGEEDIKTSEQTTAILQGAEVHGGHDALKVLVEVATFGSVRHSSFSASTRPNLQGASPSFPIAISPAMDKSGPASASSHLKRAGLFAQKEQAIPGFSPDQISTDTTAYTAAIKAWSRFRFVRTGWFTAKEGIAYISYFYKYLSPLTPVTLPDFRPLDTHEKLLTQEPMLAVTILLIASRHMRLEGPGALTRPITIHQKLWTYLQGMVDRVTWGQEQRGANFGSAGSQPGCDVNPLTRTGLRTLGTVESLMLLTEWHPRAMHFPPDEADDELMMPDEPAATPDLDTNDDDAKGIGGQRMDSWLGPCWRSDRMCWMLLGMAMSLAFEIGVFDKSEWQRHALSANGQPLSAEELQHYDKRRGNVRDLLLVYVTLTSGRLGLTSMLPSNYSKPEDSELFKTQVGEHISIQETVLQFWLRIAAIMREGNKRIFANKKFTRDLIKNGNYQAALAQFKDPLLQWRRDFDSCAAIPKFMRCILEIEYEYCRVYLNALGLQAVAERCANDFPQVNEAAIDTSRPATSNDGSRTDVAITPHSLAKWLGGDRQYMNEVREAACNLLTIVVEQLTPGEYLRHAPVRSYFRIISVAIMLLKSFSLGATESDVVDSLKLMDRTVAAIRTCIVDDMHVASQFADLLDVLTQNLKPRLIRISADGTIPRSQKQSVRSTPVPGQEGPLAHAPHQSSSRLGQEQLQATYNGRGWEYEQALRSTALQSPMPGVSDSTYDLAGNREYSIMPPPYYGYSSNQDVHTTEFSTNGPRSSGSALHSTYYDENNGYGNGSNDNDLQDWYALPLNPLLDLTGADVSQTMLGPELGGEDMLELLLRGQPQSNAGLGLEHATM